MVWSVQPSIGNVIDGSLVLTCAQTLTLAPPTRTVLLITSDSKVPYSTAGVFLTRRVSACHSRI